MTAFLTCPTPRYQDLAQALRIASRDKRVSERTRAHAKSALVAIEDLNLAIVQLRKTHSDLVAADQANADLRASLQASQQATAQAQFTAERASRFEQAYSALREEFAAIELDAEPIIANRVRQQTEPLRATIEVLQANLAAAGRKLNDRFIDARAYGIAFLLGAGGASVLWLIGLSIGIN